MFHTSWANILGVYCVQFKDYISCSRMEKWDKERESERKRKRKREKRRT